MDKILAESAVGGLPDVNLSAEELQRYARHIVLPDVGLEGQKKLKAGKVLLIGAGGLGSPAAMYLAAAGVGSIGIVEFDDVSLSNLQRQILFVTDDIGNSKALLAQFRLKEMNPDCQIKIFDEKLDKKNALNIINEFDIVLDGSDNFATRYLVNDACVLLGKPLVSGSVYRFEGQLTFIDSKNGPCYRCLFPNPPSDTMDCNEAGVIGVLPGIIGTMQANEVIKYFLGAGELLSGRLIKLDALKMKFTELHYEKNPECPVCSDKPEITGLHDNEDFCMTQNIFESYMPDNSRWEISVEELKQKIDNNEKFVLLDVREPYELNIATIGGTLIPMGVLPVKYNELNAEDEIIIYCRSGHRSHNAVEFLRNRAGFKNVKNLVGGILAWADRIDPSIQKY